MTVMRPIPYARRLSAEATEVLVRGFRPREMEDHWFIFEEDDVVHLVRSWTGLELFAVPIHRLTDGGAEIAEVLVNEQDGGDPDGLVERAEAILDVFFGSLAAPPTSSVSLVEHVYGLNADPGDADAPSRAP
jgi:hypothetical protein